MKKNIFLFSLFIFSFRFACFAQNIMECNTEFNAPLAPTMTLPPPGDCSDISNYTPDEFTSIYYVNINFHFILKDDGTGNFNEINDGLGTSDGNKWNNGYNTAKFVLEGANNLLSNNNKMNLPVGNSTNILSIPFRYRLYTDPSNSNDKGIYFWRSTADFYDNNFNSSYLKDKYSVNKEKVVDVFFITESDISISVSGRASGIGDGVGSIIARNLWNRKASGEGGYWEYSPFLNHEMGHELGLVHSFGYFFNIDTQCNDLKISDECNDTDDQAECNCFIDVDNKPHCNSWGSGGNNVMSYNGKQNAWTPCQLNTVHHLLATQNKTWIERGLCSDPLQSFTINYGALIEWNTKKELKGDLTLQNNSSLSINCEVNMPCTATIITGTGSILFINKDALLHLASNNTVNIEGEAWIKTGGRFEIHEGSTVTIKNGGKLFIEDGSELFIHRGAHLLIEPGGELNFRNKTIDKGIIFGAKPTSAFESYIEFKGKLTVADYADFTFNGNGYFKFLFAEIMFL